MNETQLAEALDHDNVIRLKDQRKADATQRGLALTRIDEAVHLARCAGFELVGPCEVSKARIVAALSDAMQQLKAAADVVQGLEERS